MTNGNIYDVMREMGHNKPQTTMGYLRFTMERRLDDFPSMQEYIQKPHKMEKMSTRIQKTRIQYIIIFLNYQSRIVIIERN